MFSVKHTNTLKRRWAHITASLALAALMLLPASCDSTEGTDDLEESRLYWLIIITNLNGSFDFRAACLSATEAAYGCADDTGFSSLRSTYVAVLESAFSIEVAATESTTDVCDAFDTAAFFRLSTAGAKTCYHTCSRLYWEEGRNTGQCTSSNYSTYLTNSSTSISSCYADCLQSDTDFVF